MRAAYGMQLPPTHVVTPGVAGANVAFSTRRGFGMAWVVWLSKRYQHFEQLQVSEPSK